MTADPPDQPQATPGEFLGVTVPTQADFQLADISLTFAEDGSLADSTMQPRIRMDLWPEWLHIARDAAVRAAAARASNPGPRADGAEFGDALMEELRASMTALAAYGAALHSFVSGTLHHAPAARPKVPPSPKGTGWFVHQTLIRAYVMPPGFKRKALTPVFGLRDHALHPAATFLNVVRHPDFPISTHPAIVEFRPSNATNGFNFTRSVIAYCAEHPREAFPDLVPWCGRIPDRLPPALPALT